VTAATSVAAAWLARPTIFPLLQRALLALLLFWLALSVWQALWSFFPEAPPLPAVEVINPIAIDTPSASRTSVDIDALVAVQLFGAPGTTVSDETLAAASGRAPAMSEEEAAVALAGIEEGAPETRLPLLLRGVVASSEAGLGQAVVEHRKLQDLYQVGDELPGGNEVVLAKVLPNLIVIDNNGRYEVLRLFETGDLLVQSARSVAREPGPRDTGAATERPARTVTSDSSAAALAGQYRDRLYADPQSLADVVRVTAIRDAGELRGYRLEPGRASAEFTALGFEAGDVVTAVNGMSLSDPANTVRLYQSMRSAREASFELLRKGESVTLTVSIGSTDGERDS
jgi:general secretion pathway protein C